MFEKYGNLRTILGPCDGDLLENAERIVVSPGVPLENYSLSSLLQSVSESSITLDLYNSENKICVLFQHVIYLYMLIFT